jgi:uncharacterized BrkB/YihY/UPF0761 family membrane protein
MKIKKKKKVTTRKTIFDKKPQIASILVYLAIVFLIFNGIYALVLRDQLISQIDQQTLQELQDTEITTELIRTTVLVVSIIWIVFAVLMLLAKIGVEKKKIGWGWLLALSIIIFFTGRIESSVLGIIASILYAKSK